MFLANLHIAQSYVSASAYVSFAMCQPPGIFIGVLFVPMSANHASAR